MLQLNQVDFGQLDCVLKRYLKEFSLPKYLAKMLKRSLGNCDQLYNLAFQFEKYQIPKKNYKEENANPVLASDIRAVALILFSLKYLYGIDDMSEYHNRNQGCFEVVKWMQLSRKRAFLACKHSSQLHKYVKKLFPGLKMTPACWYNYLQTARGKQSEMRNVASDSIVNRRFYAGEEEMAKDLAIKFDTNRFQEDFKSARKETFDCRHSKTPFYDFAHHYIEVNDGNEETSLDVKDLKALLAMHKSKIKLKFVNSATDKEQIDNISPPPFVLGKLPSAHCNERKIENVVFNSELKPNSKGDSEEGRTYNYRPLYWTSTLSKTLTALDKNCNHTSDSNSHILSMLPENFAWILQYFSSVMDIRPSELYTELLKVEAIVLKNHPDYFGTRIRSTNRSGSSHTNNDYKYKLSMSY